MDRQTELINQKKQGEQFHYTAISNSDDNNTTLCD